MSVASMANQTLTVSRSVAIRDAGGGVKWAMASVLRIQGRAQPLSGSDVQRHSRPDMRVTHKVYVPGAPDIRDGDRLDVKGLILWVQVVRDVDLAGKFTVLECEQRDN